MVFHKLKIANQGKVQLLVEDKNTNNDIKIYEINYSPDNIKIY